MCRFLITTERSHSAYIALCRPTASGPRGRHLNACRLRQANANHLALARLAADGVAVRNSCARRMANALIPAGNPGAFAQLAPRLWSAQLEKTLIGALSRPTR